MIRILLPLLIFATPALAADELMTFFMKNSITRGVALELSSRDRDQLWPGGDKVYFLEAGERKSVPIECRAGETLCYGAWVVGDTQSFWGIGPDRDRSCSDCCHVCTAKTTRTIDIVE